jgi:hypothetical protein
MNGGEAAHRGKGYLIDPRTGKKVRLPHDGRARYSIGRSHAVIIDLDDDHVVVEIHEDYLHELPDIGQTMTLSAGPLRFFYYLKTDHAVKLLCRLAEERTQ